MNSSIIIAELTGHAAAASLLAGAALFTLFWWIWRGLQTSDLEQGSEWRYDVSRINDLRRVDPMYRMLQPVIRVFARFNRGAFKEQLPEIQREIHAAGMPRCWLAEEYLAKLELIALLLSPLYLLACIQQAGSAGIILAVVATLLTVYVLRRRLSHLAQTRLTEIKRRMPFMMDLMTLLMEAGSTFLHALEQAAGEYRGHPLSQEFNRVLTDMHLGKTRQQAFEAMRDRLQDDEINSILSSMVQAEQLGTPLAGVFRTQADILRLKRSQRAELIASEAGVKMLLPGVLVMLATVIIILGPFLINFLLIGLEF
jgi:tight adherence protein C